jgi:hypothetical protein
MFNKNFFLRLLIAVVVLAVLFAILPAVFNVIGIPLSGDWILIIKAVIGICALFYLFGGTWPAFPQ